MKNPHQSISEFIEKAASFIEKTVNLQKNMREAFENVDNLMTKIIQQIKETMDKIDLRMEEVTK